MRLRRNQLCPGRRLARRSPRQYSGRALVVQRRKGIEPLMSGDPNILRPQVGSPINREPNIEFITTLMQGSILRRARLPPE